MKTKILDTNVILDYPIQEIIDSFRDGQPLKVIIPFKVVIELDTFKKGTDSINEYCRIAIRFLDSLRSLGNLSEGVLYDDNIIIQVYITREDIENLNPNKVDNNIILTAKELKEDDSQIEVVTRDLHERILADVLGIIAKDVNVDKVNTQELYTGVTKIKIDDNQVQEFFANPKEQVLRIPRELATQLMPNQFVIMEDSSGTCHYGIFDGYTEKIFGLKKSYEAWGIRPKKDAMGKQIVEQSMLMHLLLDPDIQFVSAIGASGCGKTLLALACGLEQTINKYPSLYDKIIIMRPLVGADKDIGALPGTKEEKLAPWMGASYDNLEFLLSNYMPKDLQAKDIYIHYQQTAKEKISVLMDMGKIEFEAITYIRGRSMPKQFIIVDDAQNLTPKQAATIITRAGEGSKLVFLGDVSRQQIDDHKLTPWSNGLSYVVDKLKGVDSTVGHITMKEVVRSHLAMLGVKYL